MRFAVRLVPVSLVESYARILSLASIFRTFNLYRSGK